jgi:hypothetical protein
MANRLINNQPQIIMNSKFIGYVAGLLVDRQMKNVGCCKNSWPPEKNIKQV